MQIALVGQYIKLQAFHKSIYIIFVVGNITAEAEA